MATHDVEIRIGARDQASSVLRGVRTAAGATLGTAQGGLSALANGAKVALGAAAAGAAALGAGLGVAVNTASGFESAMARVSAVTGATGESLDDMRELALEMGSTTQFAASEAAGALEFLGMAGFSANESMEALPVTLELAAAGNISLAESADIASNVLSGMRLEVDDLDGVVDGLATTASNSNTNIQQLGQGFAQVAPGAAAAGVSFEETAAALGILANNGIQAGAGGTALNAALRTMLAPSKEAAEAAKELGLEFLDTEGNVRPLTQVIGEVEAAGLTATEVFTLFGEEGGRAINALVGSGAAQLGELQGKIEDSEGAAGRMADTMTDTFAGAMKSAGSALEGVQIAIGSELLPILTTLLTDHIVPAIRSFGEWTTSIGGVRQAFADALTFVSGFGTSVLGVMDGIATDESFRSSFLTSMGGVFSAAFDLIGTFVTGTLGILGDMAAIAWTPLRLAFKLVWDRIKYIGAGAINWLGETVADGINAMIGTVNTLGEAFGLTISEVDFTPLVVDAPMTMSEAFGEMAGDVAASIRSIGDRGREMGTQLVADAGELGAAAGEALGVMAEKADPEFVAVVTKYVDSVAEPIVEEAEEAGEDAGAAIATNTATGIEDNAAVAVEAGTSMGGSISAAMQGEIGSTLEGGFRDILNGDSMRSVFTDRGADIGRQLGDAIGVPFAGVIGEQLGAVFGASVANLTDALGGLSFGGADLSQSEQNVLDAAVLIDQGYTAMHGAEGSLAREARADVEQREQGISQLALNLRAGTLEPSQLVGWSRGDLRLAAMDAGLGDSETSAIMDMIPAASGFSGTVTKPTLFLTGEGGAPERVNISPVGGGSTGGQAGAAPSVTIVNHITAMDARGVADVLESTLGPQILRYLDRESWRGVKTTYDTGVRSTEAAA